MPSPAENDAANQSGIDASVERVIRNAAAERQTPTNKPYNQALERDLILEGTKLLTQYDPTFSPSSEQFKKIAIKRALIARREEAKEKGTDITRSDQEDISLPTNSEETSFS